MAKKINARRIALAITGASGAVYGRRVLEELLKREGIEVHLVLSPSAQKVLKLEEGVDVNLERFDPSALGIKSTDKLVYHRFDNVAASVASGSFRVDAMVIAPCSMGCAAAIAHGNSDNLIERAADVMLKERRTLIVVPRETPYSTVHLKNLLSLSELGVIVLPASPGFYGKPKTVGAMVDFVVGRILDHLKIEHDLAKRWGSTKFAGGVHFCYVENA
jgi:4-hydroxy-3-polyprenylbenzoate decarboxylase